MTDNQPRDHILSNKLYDYLKFLALVVLPALGALYFGLAQIWGFPAGAEVVGSITLIDTFLGALIKISDKSYNDSSAKYDGAIDVQENEHTKTFQLSFDGDPDLSTKKEVIFKVKAS